LLSDLPNLAGRRPPARNRFWSVHSPSRRLTFDTEAFLTTKYLRRHIVRKLDRRELMMGAGGAALAGAVPLAKFFPQTAAPQQLVVRRSVGSMQPDDPVLTSYRLAVERMKALPDLDPRSWNAMMQSHLLFCPVSNWFFLPWHRAYLISFEHHCRRMSGDPNFALPYWDWTEQPQLPAAFAEQAVGGRPNSLFDSTREMRSDAVVPSPAGARDRILRIMAETHFENFSSTRPNGQDSTDARWLRAMGIMTPLEGGLGTVHATVGGDMSGMHSPLDPIFWLHHCNIDRLWARWNALGRRNTTNPLWTTFRFDGMFPDPQGDELTAWDVGVSDMLDHVAWGYTYPDLPRNPSLPADPGAEENPNPPPNGDQIASTADEPPEMHVLASETGKGSAGIDSVLSTRLTLTESSLLPDVDLSATPARGFAIDIAAANPAGRIFSILENIKTSGCEAVRVNVFLNHPSPTAATPTDDPHFVGTFGLFGMQSGLCSSGMSVKLELTRTLARLQQANIAVGKEINVQLIMVEGRGAAPELTSPERVKIVRI
jgi:tyrosinase